MKVDEIAKVRLSLDPNDMGAYVHDEGMPEPTVMLPIEEIRYVFEPDELHQTKNGAPQKISKMVKAIMNGKQMPPILVRKYKDGYQVMDGHHRFKAYRLAKATEVPVRIVDPENITGDIDEAYSTNMQREKDDAGTVRVNIKNNNVNGALDFAADSRSVYGKTPSLDSVLDESKSTILRWMENMLKNNVKDGVEAYRKVNRVVGKRWPEIDTWWEDHKDYILTTLLTLMKHGYVDTIYTMIDRYLSREVKWPELDLIMKGCKSEIYRRASLNENWSNKYKRSIDCSNPKGFSQKAHCAARRKRANGGETKSKPVRESEQISPEHEAMGIEMLSRDGMLIRNMPRATEAMKLAAVKQNGGAIYYIKDPSEAVKLAAVTQNCSEIRWIKDPSDAIKIAAVKKGFWCIQDIDDQSEELQIAAVKQNGLAIEYIRKPTPRAWEIAKHDVLKHLLTDIKDQYDIGAERLYKNIRGKNCPWPELDAIERSMKAMRIIESTLPTGKFNAEEYAKKARAAIAIGWIDNVLDRMTYGVSVGKVVPAKPIRELLEENKHDIIKHLLNAVKRQQLDDVGKIVNMLRKMGIDWTELDAFEKSLKVGIKENDLRLTAQDRKVIKQIEFGPEYLSTVKNPSLALQIAAVRHDGWSVLFLKQINPEIWNDSKVKFSLLQTLLTAVKEAALGDELIRVDLGSLWRCLLNAKCPYPELKTVKKSIKQTGMRENQLSENFADGKGPGRPGDSRRHGIPKHATLAQLDKIGKGSGRKAQLARWQANMRRGRARADEGVIERVNLAQFLKDLGNGYFESALHTLAFTNILRDLSSDIKPTIESHKDGILRHMLLHVADLRNTQEETSYYLEHVIAGLSAAGIDWPELKVISNALPANERAELDETIAPHGDPQNELKMMRAGTKPAALVNPWEFDKLYRPIIDSMGWEMIEYEIEGFEGHKFYVVAQPGEKQRAKRIVQLVQQANRTVKSGEQIGPDYHRELGFLLGYKKEDIEHFIQNLFGEKAVAEDTSLSNPGAALTVFDIDETLFHTLAKILVVKDGNVVKELDNREFNTYILAPGESFDFSQFTDAQFFHDTSVPIDTMWKRAKSTLDSVGKRPGSRVIIVTARSDFDDKELFLNTFRKHGLDIDKIHVHRAGNLNMPSAAGKKKIIGQYLATGQFDMVRLFDDAESNLRGFLSLKDEFPNIRFKAYMVLNDGSIRDYRI